MFHIDRISSQRRRSFLRSCLALGGSATLIGAAPAAADNDTPTDDKPTGDTNSAGYRLTAHVRRYYESADN